MPKQGSNTTPAATATVVLTIEEIDPATLLVDVNVRTDLRLDAEFVASIHDHGVIVPVVAVRTTEGPRVRYGHRRTRAAVQANLATIAVVLAGDEEVDDAAQIERVLRQYDENEHRTALNNAERVRDRHRGSHRPRRGCRNRTPRSVRPRRATGTRRPRRTRRLRHRSRSPARRRSHHD